jgi:hypothetical protein
MSVTIRLHATMLFEHSSLVSFPLWNRSNLRKKAETKNERERNGVEKHAEEHVAGPLRRQNAEQIAIVFVSHPCDCFKVFKNGVWPCCSQLKAGGGRRRDPAGSASVRERSLLLLPRARARFFGFGRGRAHPADLLLQPRPRLVRRSARKRGLLLLPLLLEDRL